MPYPQGDHPYPQDDYPYPEQENPPLQDGISYPGTDNQRPPVNGYRNPGPPPANGYRNPAPPPPANGHRHAAPPSANGYRNPGTPPVNGYRNPAPTPANGYRSPAPPPPFNPRPPADQRRRTDPRAQTAANTRPRDDDSAFVSRQLAGVAALMAISDPEYVLAPFSGPIIRQRYTGPLQHLGDRVYEPPAVSSQPGGWRQRVASLRTDSMVRSALYLILSTGVQAIFGFAFWIVTARFFSTDAVGRASSLISATTLIGFLGLLGLNTTFVRFLPTSRDRGSLITAGLSLVGICSGVVALGYAVLTPVMAPGIAFIAHSAVLAAGFVVLTAAGGMNVLTDSVFIAADRAVYTAWTDGLVGGLSRIAVVVAISGAGAYGIFCASAGGQLAAVIASLIIMAKVLGWRPRIKNLRETLAPVLHFSSANYVANIFLMIPNLAVPVIVLDRLGASPAAYYYVAYQLATLLYQTVFAVEQSFLAEGSHTGTVTRAFLMRSIRILLMLCIPAFILMVLLSHWVLLVFGAKYESHAVTCLIVLSTAVIPIAANNLLLTVLRLANQLKATMISNFCYAAAICGIAWFLAPRGLAATALAWPIGVSVGSVAAGIAVVYGIRRRRGGVAGG
jgi:O-antigen/teichoic acid export membrane protein